MMAAADEQELDDDDHGSMKRERLEAGHIALLHDYYKQVDSYQT